MLAVHAHAHVTCACSSWYLSTSFLAHLLIQHLYSYLQADQYHYLHHAKFECNYGSPMSGFIDQVCAWHVHGMCAWHVYYTHVHVLVPASTNSGAHN